MAPSLWFCYRRRGRPCMRPKGVSAKNAYRPTPRGAHRIYVRTSRLAAASRTSPTCVGAKPHMFRITAWRWASAAPVREAAAKLLGASIRRETPRQSRGRHLRTIGRLRGELLRVCEPPRILLCPPPAKWSEVPLIRCGHPPPEDSGRIIADGQGAGSIRRRRLCLRDPCMRRPCRIRAAK